MQNVSVKQFAEFEAENHLFERAYNGVPYWQVLRFEINRLLISGQVDAEKREKKSEKKIHRFFKQLIVLKNGVKSRIIIRNLTHKDCIFFKDVVGHDRFYRYWDENYQNIALV